MAKRRRRSKKWVSWVIIALLLIAAVVVCYFVWDAYFRDKKKDEPTTTPQSQVVTPDIPNTPEEEKKEEQPTTDEEEKDKKPQYDGEDPNKASGITGVMTYAGVNGSNLMIRVNIDQYLNGGTCSLGLRKDGGNVYSAEAPVIDSASTSTCEGFNVPVSGLPQGKLNIVIYITSGDKTGEITGEVTL